jgi:sugar phosphate isomerase/epimerase
MRVSRYAVMESVLRSGEFKTDVVWTEQVGAVALAVDLRVAEPLGVSQAREILAAHNTDVACVGGAGLKLLRRDGMAEEIKRLTQVADFCAGLGGRGVMLGLSPLEDLSVAQGDRLAKAWLQTMAPIAAERGLRLLLEPVHPLLQWAGYVHSIRHAMELTCALPGTGIVVDTAHVWWDRHLFDDLTQFGDAIGCVQLADISRDALAEARYVRVPLGSGVIPLRDIIAAIEATGYSGYYENEQLGQLPNAPPEERIEVMRAGGKWLASVLASVADRSH